MNILSCYLQQFPFSHFKFVLDTRNSKLFGKYSEYGFSLRTSTSAHATTSCVTEICSVCNSKRLITSHILFCYLFNFSPLFFPSIFFLILYVTSHSLLYMFYPCRSSIMRICEYEMSTHIL